MTQRDKKTKRFFEYIAALLLFGSNGIAASDNSLNSYDILFTRTLIGSLPVQTVVIGGYLELLSAPFFFRLHFEEKS
ncbi:MAG: hypothetical protein MUC85_05725 [Anaerolineales bacterium]|jgi:hypothetical protein|nr:hypothetical protein [Anaerolineales bacterium]